mmetsp:Transcript_26489/g.60329  ORF Transcript_26489/g.60329 Transcript_26489/m.60329 type:complete len:87 (+) Transcript_26489:197-457(+)
MHQAKKCSLCLVDEVMEFLSDVLEYWSHLPGRWCQSRSTQWHEQMCLILRGFLRKVYGPLSLNSCSYAKQVERFCYESATKSSTTA